MALLVQKYGGSSVADLDRLRAVARKIVETRRQGYDLVVVVSAMGDTTDELLAMARQLAPSPSRRELDMLLSVGERISMALLSMAIQTEGLEAVSLTGSQCGIITTASHTSARIMDVRPFRVQDALAEGNIVIVAGYQGTSYRREVTTLGRGGSDTTAVALAAALGAQACEIYSDVDGVYSADPRVILDAVQLESLSYEEMLEMARAGAKVLNEQAVAFARRAQIALYARSTHLAESQGTVIRPDGFDARAEAAEAGRPHPVAVAHVVDLLEVRASSDSADALAEALAEQDCLAWTWQPGQALVAAIKLDDLHDRQALEDQARSLGDDVLCRGSGAVSVVGAGVGVRPAWARQGLDLLAAQDIEVRALLSSALRLTWLMAPEAVEQAAQALHAHFVHAQPGPSST